MGSIAQLGGSWARHLLVALPIATSGCASGVTNAPDDASVVSDATRPDAAMVDATTVTADAPVDAGCAISSGTPLVLDGMDDLAKYPVSQRLSPGAMLGTDQAAVAWTETHLYVTMVSSAFTAAYVPLHVYVETGALLSASTAVQGKEYGGLTPALPFSPTHLIGVRRISDGGTGDYNSVFGPASGWQTRVLALESDTFVSTDHRTLSVRAPWSALGGCPTAMRLALHVVHGQAANEWKDLVPTTHTPWQMPGGGYYEIDLTGAQAVADWTLR
jgi:hypothetical protein